MSSCMVHFICMLQLLQGPLAGDPEAVMVSAGQLFERVERELGAPIERVDPDIDCLAVMFREDSMTCAEDIVGVLRAYGVYVHETMSSEGAPSFQATRDPAPPARTPPRVFLRVYAPVYVQPEDLLARLEAAEQGRGVLARIEQRTGKIVLKAPANDMLASAVDFLASLDTAIDGSSRYHAFRCRSVFARDAEEKLLRVLSREVRGRITVVRYEQINTLIVSAGVDDWSVVAGFLATIDPQGEQL